MFISIPMPTLQPNCSLYLSWEFDLAMDFEIFRTEGLGFVGVSGRVTLLWGFGNSYIKLAFDIFMHSSRVLMNVSQVAVNRLVASFIFPMSGDSSLFAAVFTMWTCCINRSQYNLNSDFFDFNVSAFVSAATNYESLFYVLTVVNE